MPPERKMPNLDFYACPDDLPPVLEFVLGRAGCRVFESYSRPAHTLAEFTSVSEIMDAFKAGVSTEKRAQTWSAQYPDLAPPETWEFQEVTRIAKEHRIHGGAALWRTPYGCFLHQSDGPRGWGQPLELSAEGLVAIPAESGAAIFRVHAASTVLVGFVAFEGKLRAARVAEGRVVLVRQNGRCFRSRF